MKARYWNGALVFLVTTLSVAAGDEAARKLEAQFDKKPGEPGYVEIVEEPILKKSDYIELVKAAHPPVQEEWGFYEQFIQIRNHFQKNVPSIFENPSWPLYVAVLAEERLKKVRVVESARATRKQKKQWTPSNSALTTASLGGDSNGRYVNRDPRSVANDDYVGSTHDVVPLRSNALGSAYQWKNGKWTFSGRGWSRVNGKWVKDKSSGGLQGATGLGKK